MIRFGAEEVVKNPAQPQGATGGVAGGASAPGTGQVCERGGTGIDIEAILAEGATRTAQLHASVLDKASALSSFAMASGKSQARRVCVCVCVCV